MDQYTHRAVLLAQAVEAMAVKADGVYLDATFGRGGHSSKILSQLGADGQLIAIDCDPQAIEKALEMARQDDRLRVSQGRFEQLTDLVRRHHAGALDGVLFDLGVSSPQLDQAGRGFSFQHDGPLDMRMDNRSGADAAAFINHAEAQEIKRVLKVYGEEKNAHRIARAIVERRQQRPFETTADLANVVAEVNRNPRETKHPATRTFQAIRIHVNDELGQIERALPQALELLKSGGRLVVIAFHSLEDRLVKRFFRQQARPEQPSRRMPMAVQAQAPRVRLLGKPVKAVECDDNVRARSAIMRVAEKL